MEFGQPLSANHNHVIRGCIRASTWFRRYPHPALLGRRGGGGRDFAVGEEPTQGQMGDAD